MIYLNNKILRKMVPENPNIAIWLEPLTLFMQKYDIGLSQIRIAHFMAQLIHESQGFTRLVENLNYSADGLLKTFPTHFNPATAATCARHPEVIASIVYADRMGNGAAKTGDGWRYRGRGLVQLTGKYNYQAFAQAIDISLNQVPTFLETPVGAVSAAGWYWDSHHCNTLADADDIRAITKVINGGTNGLEARKQIYQRCLLAFEEEPKKPRKNSV